MISVIVPVWNHVEDLTKPFVFSMLECEGDFELIIVDNGSADQTLHFLNSIEDKRLKIVYSSENLGFGGGNNLGYEASSGDEICFLSNDVIINDKKFLLKLSSKLAEKNGQALIGPQYIDYNTLTNFDMKPTPYLGGWCVYGSRRMFEVIKKGKQIFDEDFGKAYFEDVWLSYLCKSEGYELVELPLNIHHMISKSSDQINISDTMLIAQRVFLEKMSTYRKKYKKRIVFFVPDVAHAFTDEDYEGKGVGGAEASLILFTRELARKGYRVEVYNKNPLVGKFNGVMYEHLDDYVYNQYTDVFILFRAYHPVLEEVSAGIKVFWTCDQWTNSPGVWNTLIFPNVDYTVGISKYHVNYLKEHYSVEDEKIEFIDLGINLSDYPENPEKIEGKAIFCSVPDRGLERLAEMLPEIKRRIPEFNLVITSDYRLWGTEEPLNELHRARLSEYDYVTFLGKVPRNELVKHQLESQVMAYPTNYEECFCIAAMECMAAGAVPVTFDFGAMKTTVGKGGLVLSNCATDEEYIDSLVELLNGSKVSDYRKIGRQITNKHDWSVITNKWISLFEEIEMAKATEQKIEINEAPVEAQPAPDVDTVPQPAKKVKTLSKPQKVVELPKIVKIPFSVHVEVTINGRNYVSEKIVNVKEERVYHVLTIAYEHIDAVLSIIKEAYGNVQLEK